MTTISEAIAEMNLSDLCVFREAVNDLMGTRRRALLLDKEKGNLMVGIIQRVTKKTGKGRATKIKLVRLDHINAEIQQYDKGTLILNVVQPGSKLGMQLEASEELVHEPFEITEEEEQEDS